MRNEALRGVFYIRRAHLVDSRAHVHGHSVAPPLSLRSALLAPPSSHIRGHVSLRVPCALRWEANGHKVQAKPYHRDQPRPCNGRWRAFSVQGDELSGTKGRVARRAVTGWNDDRGREYASTGSAVCTGRCQTRPRYVRLRRPIARVSNVEGKGWMWMPARARCENSIAPLSHSSSSTMAPSTDLGIPPSHDADVGYTVLGTMTSPRTSTSAVSTTHIANAIGAETTTNTANETPRRLMDHREVETDA
ncbi:hypothetical protein D9619_013359 [Psilocybe cf. subviscida]|uniref:Uncharacterized protein n=1 Tax=Psilocybe cf. subviscida TaxID=2480587 RepID=A0A8H5F9P9_9AGAR|nr:hypothetical protein D9619_013359 [Psilocybe cf. subviscida]